MKLFLLPLLALSAFGQVTFNVQITGEPAVAITISAEGLAAGTNLLLSTVGPGTSPTTLTAPATNVQTTFTVANALGVTTCMGIKTGSEVSLITGIAGNVLTVTRHTLGTAAAAYSSGQAVNFVAWGSGTCFLAFHYTLGIQGAMISTPGPLVVTQNTNVATATTAISTQLATAVTHVP